MNFVSRLPRATLRNTLLLVLLIALLPIPLMRTPVHSQDPASPPIIPDPPVPMPLPAGTPQEQAIAFADAMDATPDNVAAWLGLYDALDIPVIAPDGTSLGVENADPIGPQYWEVWYTSAATPDLGISLADFAQLVGLAMEDTTTDYGALLLQDIRESAVSTDPRVQLFALFAIERMTRGGPSPVDETITPDQITVDPALLLVLGWSVIRAGVYEVASQSTSALPGDDAALKLSPDADAVRPAQTNLSTTCMEGDNTDEIMMDTWTAFALSDLRSTRSGFSEALKNVSRVLGPQIVARVEPLPYLKEIMPVGYLLGLLMAGFQVEISASPAPFVRTRSQAEWGESAEVIVTVRYSTTSLPSGDLRNLCASYFAAKSFGGKLAVPANGPISSARVTANLSTGSDRVGFTQGTTSDNNTRVDGSTDASGQLVTTVKGRPQANEIPETARRIDLEYGVIVVLEMEELVGLNGDRYLMAGGTTVFSIPAGADSPMTQALDQLSNRFRLGSYAFPFQDWEVTAWRAYIGTARTDTVVCDFESPISAYGSMDPIKYEIEMTPTNATSGTFTQIIRMTQGTWTEIMGTYTLTYIEKGGVAGTGHVAVDMRADQTCIYDPNSEDYPEVCVDIPDISVAPIYFSPDSTPCESE